jgi:hypothetical protein
MPHDPRAPIELLPRDAAALAFIGRGYEVAQYQLRAAVFPGLSEVVTSRRVRRWVEAGFITVERFQGFGINRLRLTEAGRDAVVAAGAAPAAELFVPSKAVALKDLAHTLWINDLRVLAAEGVPFVPERIAPAWLFQRLFPSPAIPDLVLWRRARDGKRGQFLAVEVDLGAERLAATFVPKLELLAGLCRGWAERDQRAGIVILTRGPRRLASLQAALAERALPVGVAAALLPSALGGEALTGLRALFSPGASSSAQPPVAASTAEPVVPSLVEAEGARGLSGDAPCGQVGVGPVLR